MKSYFFNSVKSLKLLHFNIFILYKSTEVNKAIANNVLFSK